MIIIEFFIAIFKKVARFLFWITTARDCEHCKHSYVGFFGYACCGKLSCEKNECLNTVRRKHFERDKE